MQVLISGGAVLDATRNRFATEAKAHGDGPFIRPPQTALYAPFCTAFARRSLLYLLCGRILHQRFENREE